MALGTQPEPKHIKLGAHVIRAAEDH
jgi:hypothetical protein